MVRQFADEQILPNAEHYDHEDLFPEPIVEQMKDLGLFGVTIPEEYGGMGLDLTTYAMIVEELSRGWISISGVINTHFIGSYLLMKFGSEEQKQKYAPTYGHRGVDHLLVVCSPSWAPTCRRSKPPPRRATTAPTRSTARRVGHQRPCLLGVRLGKTDPDAQPRHKGFTCFIAEKEGGVCTEHRATTPA